MRACVPIGLTVLILGLGRAEPSPGNPDPDGKVTGATVLGMRGTRFTLNGEPTFLLGMSYYGALGAPEEFVRRDLADLARHGFNRVRVWATWGAFDRDVSAVDAERRPREPYLDRLKRLVAECDRRGLVVDVTLTRGDRAQGEPSRNSRPTVGRSRLWSAP